VRCCHRASSSVTLQFRINPEFSAQTRPFARLHRLHTLRWLPWQGQSSRPASSHSFVAATVPVRSKSSTYRIPFGLRHGSSPLNPLHRPTHELSHRPSTFSPRRDSVGFPSQRIPRDRRAQPINGTSKLTLVFSPIFLSSPAAFLRLDATGSSFRIRYCLPGLLFHQPDKPTQRLGTLSCLRLGFSFFSTSALL
jgi:hypothetical protein